jgi:hypothetical protein
MGPAMQARSWGPPCGPAHGARHAGPLMGPAMRARSWGPLVGFTRYGVRLCHLGRDPGNFLRARSLARRATGPHRSVRAREGGCAGPYGPAWDYLMRPVPRAGCSVRARLVAATMVDGPTGSAS